jgi:hypothetical protein
VGASPDKANTDGGGGGGGGFYPGGGGQGSAPGFTPGGGGGGGSNYTGPTLSQVIAERGGGGAGNGRVVIEWDTPPPDTVVPPPPTGLRIGDVPIDTETATRFPGGTATLYMDMSLSDDFLVRGIVRYATMADFSDAVTVLTSRPVEPGEVADALLAGLAPNTLYRVRAWAQDQAGHISESYSESSFWTNRPPSPPDLLTPSENNQFSELENITFTWDPEDPDDPDGYIGWEFRYRPIAVVGQPQPDWQPVVYDRLGTSYTVDAGTFKGNTFYEWTVRTRDGAGVWGDFALPRSLYVISETTPPRLAFPIRDEAVVGEDPNFFRWVYADPEAGSVQQSADLRYRVYGTDEWLTMYGNPSPSTPGSTPEWVIPGGTFVPGYHYEWAARTTNEDGFTSEWSPSETFWSIEQPGQGAAVVTSVEPRPELPPLGCGVNRFFVYDKGGIVRRGELTPIAQYQYRRQRDDISNCTLALNGFGSDCGELLSSLRTWLHEIVVFRDGHRVWEGPISRIDLGVNEAEIEAKDVMNYVYRRIMRQGYNDAYREVNGVKVYGGMSVTRRASLITMNALAYDDPNVLKWMTALIRPDDAVQHRSVADYTKTAWEEIDDLAAHAGLDYTVVGRRIMFWDTHRPIGRLPEMRDGHFSEPPRITEYGMQLANHLGTTNGSGVYGVAERGIVETPSPNGVGTFKTPLYYGWIEQLISAYGETEGAEPDTLTTAARADLEQTLAKQSDRNIAGRWPAPVVVRVPDNSTLNPEVQLSFDHLVPGVWIPVRATGTLREVSQWQKLDSVTVTGNGDTAEKIAVVMSPAPNGGLDPDADAAQEE